MEPVGIPSLQGGEDVNWPVARTESPLAQTRMLKGEHAARIGLLRYQGLSSRAIGRELGISDDSIRRLAAG